MKPMMKGIAIALVHVAIVSSLGAKLLIDRARCPRVWAKTVSYDPDLPIRGRYLTAQLEVAYPEGERKDKRDFYYEPVRLSVTNGQLTATPDPTSNVEVQRRPIFSNTEAQRPTVIGYNAPVVREPVLFFLPEHYDASRLNTRGQEVWMEVTVPRQGPPRPLHLAIKRDGKWEPLEVR